MPFRWSLPRSHQQLCLLHGRNLGRTRHCAVTEHFVDMLRARKDCLNAYQLLIFMKWWHELQKKGALEMPYWFGRDSIIIITAMLLSTSSARRFPASFSDSNFTHFIGAWHTLLCAVFIFLPSFVDVTHVICCKGDLESIAMIVAGHEWNHTEMFWYGRVLANQNHRARTTACDEDDSPGLLIASGSRAVVVVMLLVLSCYCFGSM